MRCEIGITALVLVLAGLSVGAIPAAGVETLALDAQASDTLSRLQRQWLEWLSTYYQGDELSASHALEVLLAEVRELGMERLPEPSLAAAAAAVDSASQGDFVRARIGLEAAELLDPGRPEVAFAAARVARLAGRPLEALERNTNGQLRTLKMPVARTVMFADLALWLLKGVTISAVCMIALLMAVRGRYPASDLLLFLSRFVPRPLAALGVVLLLCWPALLPAGPIWLALYWSLLLWTYVGTEEKTLVASVLVVLLLAPIVVETQRRRAEVALNPAYATAQELAQGRLDGTFVSDLNELRRLLPDSIAVTHLFGDVHIRLGQWGEALDHYVDVLDEEPENEAALVDAGVCYFRAGDYARAIEHFRRAAELPHSPPEAYFNLSQAYSELYRFDQAESALSTAQEMDHRAVAEWIRLGDVNRVVTLGQGFDRLSEIRRELQEVRSEQDRRLRDWSVRPLLGLTPVLALFVLAGLGLRVVRRQIRGVPRVAKPGAGQARRGWVDVALPDWPEAEAGSWGRSFLALLPVVLLLTLPLSIDTGYRTPVGFHPGPAMVWILAAIGLAVYYLVRLYNHAAR